MKYYRIIAVTPDSDKKSRDKYINDILSLWKNNLSNSSYERFHWLYKENSARNTRTWLAIDDSDKRIVGCNSLYPRYILKNGERLRMGIAIDFAVEKKHRVYGPALKIQREITDNIRKEGFDFTFAWPNEASKGVFLRAGYRILGEAINWVKPLKTEPQLIKYIKVPFIAKALGYCVDKVLCFVDRWVVIKVPQYLTPQILKSSDERFDILWERGKASYNIIGEKSSDYLNWRYANCKTEVFQFFCLIDKESQALRAYLVYSLKDNIAKIWDLFALSYGEIVYLLSEFVREMRKVKVNSISITYLENNRLKKIIRKLNFSKRLTRRTCAVFIDKSYSEEDREYVLDKNNWFLLEGEMDL